MSVGIEFDQINMRYGNNLVLENVSFHASPGEVTGLLGRNGAGKTTALRILSGLTIQSSGKVRIDGTTFGEHSPGTVGVALSTEFPSSRKVIEQLKVTAWAFGVRSDRISEVVDQLEMSKYLNVRIKKLSLGMKQRLNIACAILSDPQTLIFDEPVNGLDPDGILWIHNYIRAEAKKGKTVLLSSHYLNDMDQFIDRAVILQKKILLNTPWEYDPDRSLQSLFEKYSTVE